MTVYTYDPRKVIVTLNNSHDVHGYAEDTFVNLEPAGDGVSVHVGADGEVARDLDPNEIWNMKLTLQQNSDSHKFLQKMYDKDKKSGDGMFPVLIKDKINKETFSSAYAWVVKPAAYVRGKTSQNREWEIACSGCKFN